MKPALSPAENPHFCILFRRKRTLGAKGEFAVGFLFAILAGAAMSVQGVMNTRLSEKLGLYESNVWVQGTAFALSLLAMWILGKGSFREIGQTPKVYLLGGALGLAITLTVMLAIGRLSPTVAISTILISQLFVAAVIDAFGWLGAEKVAFHWNQFAGIALLVGGVVLFKLKL